ncbi:GntR family transcriptional regulator [Marinibacterium sp. SX1]|uniref:GntR family transcriptional regulator n=1 Tax=Marinibacterium sp. SX1 TaxID=3388424 RepID=UPI003D1737B0
MADTILQALDADRAVNQVDLAYERIEDMIVMMEMQPGARVVESALVKQLDIGRTPIREALLRLAADGLLVATPRKGMTVRGISFSLQMKVFETRRALEMVLVPAAARRRTRDDAEILARVVQSFRELSGGDDNRELLRLDRHFIRLLIAYSGNPFLGQILPLYSLSRRFWWAHHELYQTQYRDQTLTDFHIEIGDAVVAGDETLARDRAEAFLAYVEDYTVYLGRELAGRERT